MNDLKKIAADVLSAARWIDDSCGEETEIGTELREHADALDALAAQSQVHRCGLCDHVTELQHVCENCGERCAAPPPAASVSMAELEKALDVYGLAMVNGHFYRSEQDRRERIERISAARAKVLRLASPGVVPSVSREAFVAAYSELFNNDDPSALRALGIEVKP